MRIHLQLILVALAISFSVFVYSQYRSGHFSLAQKDQATAACNIGAFTITTPPQGTYSKECIQDNKEMYYNSPGFVFFQPSVAFNNAPYIKTENISIKSSQTQNIIIQLTQEAAVYTLYRYIPGQSVPTWLSTNFNDSSGDNLSSLTPFFLRKNSDGLIGLYKIYKYKNTVSAGSTVTFGPPSSNSGTAFSMYIPVIVPAQGVPQPSVIDGIGDSHAIGIWTPTVQDTCSKEIHDSYSVIGPDGKRYPTWHPPVDPKTGCKFGHEHGRDPKQYPDWPKIQEYFAYDANHNNVIEPAELASAGVPFGYVNEQLDTYNAVHGQTTLMRHEDHVGHKIEWESNGDLYVHNGPGDTSSRHSVAKCNYFGKIHQGTHSKDAFENNLHEAFILINCPSEGYDVRIAKMVSFGAAGEFATGLPCPNREAIQQVGFDYSNQSYPGARGAGRREIPFRNCLNQNFLVPSGRFTTNVYEIWIGDTSIRGSGRTLVQSPGIQFASFDPIRFFDPGKPDNLGHMIDLCYETVGTNQARGNPCSGVNGARIAWDSPQSVFLDAKRETYFSAGPIDNASGSIVSYSDPFGNNAQATYTPGSVRQYIVNKKIDIGAKYGGIVDTSAYGSSRYYGGNGVHAPN